MFKLYIIYDIIKYDIILKKGTSFMNLPNETKSLKINLSSTEILNKLFKKKTRGYDPVQVNEYLDQVAQDYASFEKTFSDMTNYINVLELQAKQSGSRTSSTTGPVSIDDLDDSIKSKLAFVDKLIARSRQRTRQK